MTRILIVSSEPYKLPSVPLGGIFQEHQGEALARAGHRVGVASGGLLPLRSLLEPLPPRQETNGALPVTRRFSRSFVPLRFRGEARLHRQQTALLSHAIRDHVRAHGKPDVIHAHNLQYAALAAQRCASELGVPYCITEHNSAFLLGSLPVALYAPLREAVERSAGFACVSGALARAVRQTLGHDAPTLTLPNILDPQLEAEARRFTPSVGLVTDHPLTLLAIGRLDRNKNHALLLRAFAQAFHGGPERLRLVGAGTEGEALRQLAGELNIARQVEFLGLQNRTGILDALRRCDALVQTSTVETFGVSLIEALAFGNPVITTPSGGPSDIVVHGLNGEVLPDHQVGTLAAALIRLRAAQAFVDRAAIQRHALQTYGAASFVRTIESWYADMTAYSPTR